MHIRLNGISEIHIDYYRTNHYGEKIINCEKTTFSNSLEMPVNGTIKR